MRVAYAVLWWMIWLVIGIFMMPILFDLYYVSRVPHGAAN